MDAMHVEVARVEVAEPAVDGAEPLVDAGLRVDA